MVNKSGYYNAFLKDKYFYQIGIAKNVWKLKKETLVDVTQKDEVFNNGDVLNKQLVLKLIGGK